jgi:hypothetical protein
MFFVVVCAFGPVAARGSALIADGWLIGSGFGGIVERRHLVYVLPGIGGSALERKKPGGNFSTLWDAGFGDIADLLIRPGRMSVEEQEHLRPVGLIRSKHLLPGWPVVHGYGRLEPVLQALPGVRLDTGHPERRVRDANVVFFPYDFRRSIVEAAELLDADVRARLAVLGGDGARRVVMVAHSMGGLVARYWMGPLGGWPVCRALVTLGTPHRGAPKALDVLANGVPVGVGRLRRPGQVIAGWASVGELLPAYRAVWDQEAGVARYPHELPLDAVRPLAQAGYAVHQQITESWGRQVPREGPEVRAYFGFSHGTARSAVWGQGRLGVGPGVPRGEDLSGWAQDLGDGTVPAFCAVPVEASGSDVRELRVPHKHGPLAVSPLILRLLEYYEGRADISAIQGAGAGEVPAVLGLDVADLHPAGAPIRVQVQVVGVDGPVGAAPVWVQAFPADTQDTVPPVAEIRAVWDQALGAFACELPGQGPGLFDLVVRARSVPGVGDLECADSIGVVEP